MSVKSSFCIDPFIFISSYIDPFIVIYVLLYSLCFKVYFVWYKRCNSCFPVISTCTKYLFSIPSLSVYVSFVLRWISCKQNIISSCVFYFKPVCHSLSFDWKESESESCLVMSDSLWPHELYSPWNSSGQNTEVGSLSLLQGIFPTLESNPGLPHCRWILYQLSQISGQLTFKLIVDAYVFFLQLNRFLKIYLFILIGAWLQYCGFCHTLTWIICINCHFKPCFLVDSLFLLCSFFFLASFCSLIDFFLFNACILY